MNNDSLYRSKRALIRTGDALQWKSATALGFTIRLFSRNKDKDKRTLPGYDVNHTSFAIQFSEYDWVRRFTTEALEKGVDINLLSRRITEYRGEVWCLPLKEQYNYLRNTSGKIALSHIGIDYDYPSLFEQPIKRVRPDNKLLFCSEHYFIAISETFSLHGYTELDEFKFAPRPCDIPDLGIFDEPFKIK